MIQCLEYNPTGNLIGTFAKEPITIVSAISSAIFNNILCLVGLYSTSFQTKQNAPGFLG
jgi:hypothetical protein